MLLGTLRWFLKIIAPIIQSPTRLLFWLIFGQCVINPKLSKKYRGIEMSIRWKSLKPRRRFQHQVLVASQLFGCNRQSITCLFHLGPQGSCFEMFQLESRPTSPPRYCYHHQVPVSLNSFRGTEKFHTILAQPRLRRWCCRRKLHTQTRTSSMLGSNDRTVSKFQAIMAQQRLFVTTLRKMCPKFNMESGRRYSWALPHILIHSTASSLIEHDWANNSIFKCISFRRSNPQFQERQYFWKDMRWLYCISKNRFFDWVELFQILEKCVSFLSGDLSISRIFFTSECIVFFKHALTLGMAASLKEPVVCWIMQCLWGRRAQLFWLSQFSFQLCTTH